MKINLASGQRPFKKPWINIDVKNQGYDVDILTDVKNLSMIESDSVDIIVAHHLVEHIAIHELSGYLNEWRRVLKSGGRLAVFVPNLWEINRAWLEGRIDTFIHNVNTYGAYQDSIHDLHKWGYSETELVDRLYGKNNSGQTEINWSTYRTITPQVLSEDVYRGSDCCLDWWILAIEFTK